MPAAVRRRSAWFALSAALALTGCAGGNVAPGPETVLLHVQRPLRSPVWSDHDSAVVGLTTDGSRVERVQPSSRPGDARSAVSGPLPGIGRDLAPGMPSAGVVYVPRPRSGSVTVLDVANLQPVRTLHVGPAPAYLALDTGADALLALSRDGGTVTSLDLEHHDVSTRHVDATPDTDVDGPEREGYVEFHLTGTAGIEHYLAGKDKGTLDLPVTDAVGDRIKVTRLYVAEQGTDNLIAVDSRRDGSGLTVVGRAELGAPVRFVGDDARRVFAVTADRLVVLETRSYGGYPHGRIPVLQSVGFRTALPPSVRSATVSGIAVGRDRVYLTFADAPYVLSIAKPNV